MFQTNAVYRFNYTNSNPTKKRLVLVQKVEKDKITGVELDTGDIKNFFINCVTNLKKEKYAELPEAASPYAKNIFATMLDCSVLDVEIFSLRNSDKIYGLVAVKEPKLVMGLAGTTVSLTPDGSRNTVLFHRDYGTGHLILNNKKFTPSEFIEYLTKAWL